MPDHWLLLPQAAELLKCDTDTLRRWTDAGQLQSRSGPLGLEIHLNIDAAATIEELAAAAAASEAPREPALALAIARAAREDAVRARRSFTRAIAALVMVATTSAATIGYLSYRTGVERVHASVAESQLASERATSHDLLIQRDDLRAHLEEACLQTAHRETELAAAQSELTRLSQPPPPQTSPALLDRWALLLDGR